MNIESVGLREFRKEALKWSSNAPDDFEPEEGRYWPTWTKCRGYFTTGVHSAFMPTQEIRETVKVKDKVTYNLPNGHYCPPFLNGGTHVAIDNMETYITDIHRDFAKGFVVSYALINKKMFTMELNTLCYVCRKRIPGTDEYLYAHGSTMREAFMYATQKLDKFENFSTKMDKFKTAFPEKDVKYKASDLFYWHGAITGSCEFGRREFCKEHGINLAKDEFTINEFFDLVLSGKNFGNEYVEELVKLYR